MSYEDLLALICKELPHLKGQLQAPQVVYVRAQGKVYITFQSGVLVEEQSFLRMEAILRRAFPQKPLALRVVSPGLRQDFLDNISAARTTASPSPSPTPSAWSTWPSRTWPPGWPRR